MIISIDEKKFLTTPIYDENFLEEAIEGTSRQWRPYMTTHGKCYSECWRTESFSSKVKNKTMMSTLATISKHSFASPFIIFQSFSHIWLFATPWATAWQASLSFTISWSLLKLLSVRPLNHFILYHPLLLLPSIFPSIKRLFSNESVLHIRWPVYWSFSFSISPSDENSRLISFRIDWFDLLAVQWTLKSLLQHYVQKYQFFGTQLYLFSNSHIHAWLLDKP